MKTTTSTTATHLTKAQILDDYRVAVESRQASLLGRKEVFAGKAKFGIFGDGKELPQLALARAFKKGDFRSGYYRDQTIMFALGELTLKQFFAQLYSHPSLEADPHSAGRQMSCHYSTRSLDEFGNWKDLTAQYNSSPDMSPTAGQMPRLLGLAYASKLYRQNPELKQYSKFSKNGNEIAFGTIGNASTSEGMFFEAINAAGVLQVPMLVSVWDDDYGISVPKEYHTSRGDISLALSGFQREDGDNGIEIFSVKGWDYVSLLEVYQNAQKICREQHVPVLVHVTELTQPQGHSTSGSHERYKSKERLEWEKEYDCNLRFREWIIAEGLASAEELEALENKAIEDVKKARTEAWNEFVADAKPWLMRLKSLIEAAGEKEKLSTELSEVVHELNATVSPLRSDVSQLIDKTCRALLGQSSELRTQVLRLKNEFDTENEPIFHSHLHSESEHSPLLVKEVKPVYLDNSPVVDGREVLQAYFSKAFEANPLVFAIGEDVGKIGDVNQGFAGLQEKFGEIRITDTGIRECTIAGQGIGAALRGLRPIIEIQYLDYLPYALQILSDDLASLHFRSKGGQKAPLIVRTRGHRLEGIWHSGSPMGMIINSLRGMHVLVPRNMTQAAGFYNTLLQSDDPALVIECLNGYRLKEKLPENLDQLTVPLGVPEVLKAGTDVTLVTYGSMVRVAIEAIIDLEKLGISVELIDVQSLLPFDRHQSIVESLKKTNRIVFADEDVPGGATAFMMQQVLEIQGGYRYLDAQPVTITAAEHRPAYASDGDYFSKPSPSLIFEKIYQIMHESNPAQFKPLFE
jgi:pyruvate/2-oxoglutarate/acetoin dehydrogenase E1 component/TPP-dependent pyruvate/acetoin dehydrogenase alpha subunit